MSGPFGSSQWMYSSGAAFYPFAIDQSLRFNDNDSAYLSRTPASAGNRKTWTWSGWVKRGSLGSWQYLFGSNVGAAVDGGVLLSNTDNIGISVSGNIYNKYTSAVLRDTSAWYHIVATLDTDNATAADRIKLYINGVEQTNYFTLNIGLPPSGYTPAYLNNANNHDIGKLAGYSQDYFDGYLAEVNFIDGTALDASSFGEFKSGVWVAKEYTGSYGTNGFHLTFADSGAIGDDTSGNTNDWTANNLAATDVLPDSPTNNFATMNPLWKSSNTVLAEGNLYLPSASYYSNAVGTMGVSSGKWYFEARVGNNFGSYSEFGVIATDDNTFINKVSSALRSNVTWHQLSYIYSNGTLVTNPTSPSFYNTATKIIGCAVDLDNNKVYFHGNGTWLNSSDPDTNTGGTTIAAAIQGKTFVPLVGTNNVSASPNTWVNFGQDGSFAGTETAQGNTDDNGIGDFYYAPPSGYLALCTANLPDPVIDPAKDDVPSDYFNTVLYTGNGSTNVITGVGFQPDFVWTKLRSQAGSHSLADVIRGGTAVLRSDLTNAEATRANHIQSFDTDGFTLGADGTSNLNGTTNVAWNWLAGNGTSSNTDGSISSTISVNQKAGFSVVSWTGNGSSAQTVGHGLNATPSVILAKTRSDADSWVVYHSSVVTTDTQTLYLNLTNGLSTVGTSVWDISGFSSTTFGIGANDSINENTDNFIAYCFAEVEGYSKFGSFVGNGSNDGPMIFTGHSPAFLMVKRTDSSGDWYMFDKERATYNVVTTRLWANLSSAELSSSVVPFDFLSNGFKARNSDASFNANGGTYIYLSFASNPFKYSTAR